MSALPSRLILPGDQPLSTPRAPGLIRPVETLLRLDRLLLRGVDIYDWLARHGIEPTASIVNMMLMSGGVLAPVTTIYDCTGADQTYTVPWGVYWLKVELWGAAGAGYSATVTGGPGGYTTGLLAVTPGEVLTIIVGETGGVAVKTAQTAVKYGGGGIGGTYASPSQGWNAPGGGRSAILRANGTEVATAGGGGGGTYYNSGANNGCGGAGGGAAGADATGISNLIGHGGNQTAAGTRGTDGTATAGAGHNGGTGGTTYNGGAGGGGGVFGGGGGNGGGGGSGYVGGLINGTTTAGSGVTPPGTASANYATGIAIGGTSTSTAAGNGRVAITTVP